MGRPKSPPRDSCPNCGAKLIVGQNISASAIKSRHWLCKDCEPQRRKAWSASRDFGGKYKTGEVWDTINLVIDDETTVNVFPNDKAKFILGGLKIVCGIPAQALSGADEPIFYDGKPLYQIRIFDSPEDMRDWIVEYFLSDKYELTRRRKIYVWQHNASFDFRLVFNSSLGFKAKLRSDKPFNYSIKYKNTVGTIIVRDTMSYFPTSLENIMKDWRMPIKKTNFDAINEINNIKSQNQNWKHTTALIERLTELQDMHASQPREVFIDRVSNDVEATAKVVKRILEEHAKAGIRTPRVGNPSLSYMLWAKSIEPKILLMIDPTMFYDLYIHKVENKDVDWNPIDDATLEEWGIRAYEDKKGRRRYYRPKIFPYSKIGLAAEACYGGRCEVFDVSKGYWYYLDKNSLYCEVMITKRLPTRLIHTIQHPTKDEVRALLKSGFLIAARLKANIPASEMHPPFPKRHGGKLRFNTGEFETVVCSPEFEDHFDYITEFLAISVYESAYITRDYMSEVIKRKEEAEEQGDFSTRAMMKHFYTDPSGKFGEHAHKENVNWYDYLKRYPELGLMSFEKIDATRIELEDGDVLCKRADCWVVEEQSNNTDDFLRFSAIYAFITANARKILRTGIMRWNPAYVDTDSNAVTYDVIQRIREEDSKLVCPHCGCDVPLVVNKDGAITKAEKCIECGRWTTILGSHVGQWKIEHEGYGRFITQKVYVLGTKTKLKGAGKNAAKAYSQDLLESKGETILVEGERMTTMRESADVVLKDVEKHIKTKSDKRVYLSDGSSVPIRLIPNPESPKTNVFVCSHCHNEYKHSGPCLNCGTKTKPKQPIDLVVCPYCCNAYDEWEGYKHIMNGEDWFDLLEWEKYIESLRNDEYEDEPMPQSLPIAA